MMGKIFKTLSSCFGVPTAVFFQNLETSLIKGSQPQTSANHRQVGGASLPGPYRSGALLRTHQVWFCEKQCSCLLWGKSGRLFLSVPHFRGDHETTKMAGI